MSVGRKGILTPQVMEHYLNVQPTPHDHSACAALPGAIVGATDWLGSIWNDRKAFTDLPALLLWGMKDIAVRRKELERWHFVVDKLRSAEFEGCGHFLSEDNPEQILPLLTSFMARI